MPSRTAGAVGLLSALAVLWLAALAAPAARAGFGTIQLQSVGPLDQFEQAAEPAISADGRYLAFQGTLDGVKGVFRKDLVTGAVELVVGGSVYDPEPQTPTDAFAPSISADGQYVSFTSRAALVPRAHADGNVYVRDMALPLPPSGAAACSSEEEERQNGRACAYELASALDGSSEGIEAAGRGALASGRVALSASGREVVFVVQGESDLTSPTEHKLTTPPMQVAVRYLDSYRTVLVSAERDPSTGQMTERPVGLTAQEEGEAEVVKEGAVTETDGLPGAALSADGSTVAWLGANIPAQAPTLEGERQEIERDDRQVGEGEHYDEPLWRRIGDLPVAPTRRMVGGGDPLAPGCPPGGTLEVPACRGPYPGLPTEGTRGGLEKYRGWIGQAAYPGVPQLSRDGWTTALIGDPDGSGNLFMVDMHEGLSRVQALRQLTREVAVPFVTDPGSRIEYAATAGDVYDDAISPDGTRIAFATQRQQFPLAPPNYLEEAPAQLGLVELYQIDLANESLVRVTRGPDDGPSLESGHAPTAGRNGASSPSYSEDDSTIAFADTASNLVSGDGNGAGDVFTAPYSEAASLPGAVYIGPTPIPASAAAQWRLSVVATTHRDGSLTLDVDVPGAGTLLATATATVPVAPAAGSRSQRGVAGRHHVRHTTAVSLAKRQVAAAKAPVSVAGLLALPLRIAKPFAHDLRTPAGIYATVRVSFHGSGGQPLEEVLTVSLHAVIRHGAKKASRHANGDRRRS